MTNRFLAVSPALFGMMSIVLGLTGVLWCQTFIIRINDYEITYVNGTSPVANNNSTNIQLDFDYHFGIYLYKSSQYIDTSSSGSSDNTCARYPDYVNYDTPWRTAAIMQVISWIFAGVCSLRLLCMCCWGGRTNSFRCIGLCYILVCVTLEGLAFLLFKSDACSGNNPMLVAYFPTNYDLSQLKCELGPSATLILMSILGYFLSGLLCLCLGHDYQDDYPRRKKPKHNDDDDDDDRRVCFCFKKPKQQVEDEEKQEQQQTAQQDVDAATAPEAPPQVAVSKKETGIPKDEVTGVYARAPNPEFGVPSPPEKPTTQTYNRNPQQQAEQLSSMLIPTIKQNIRNTKYATKKPDPIGRDRTSPIIPTVSILNELVRGSYVTQESSSLATSEAGDEEEIMFEDDKSNVISRNKKKGSGIVRFSNKDRIHTSDMDGNETEELFYMSCHDIDFQDDDEAENKV